MQGIKLFIIFTAFTLLGCSCESRKIAGELEAAQKSIGDNELFKVVKLVDGDTFWVEDRLERRIKIRLIGMDAPENRNAFKKKKHPLGAISSAYLESLLKNSPFLYLDFDVNKYDAFGRTLAYAYLSDGTMINEQMVRNGYAVLMTVPPNVKYEQRFKEAQQKARESNLGIWAIPVSD